MLLGGKFLKPISSWGFVHRENFDNKLKSQFTFIQAPAGYILTESLAAILVEYDHKIIWLRFGWEEFDPGTCLLSLIKAFQVASEEIGRETLEKMRKIPGPIQGWQNLFAQLGHEIEAYLPESAILVLENLQHPAQSPFTLAMLINHFFPALPDQMRVILISPKNLPGYSLPKDLKIVKSQDLKLSPATIKRMFQPMGLIANKETIKQAVHLMAAGPVGLAGIYLAGQLLGEEYVQEALQRQTTRDGLLNQIARDWLSTLDEQDIRAMATLLILGYNNSAINLSQTGKGELAPSPWSQKLEKGWIRPHRLWLNGIKAALRTNPSFSTVSIKTLAYYLCQSGFYITGIELLFASKAFTHAAEYLVENIDSMLNLGQWELLDYWLDRLPEPILHSQPRLLHASGEIRSASGDMIGANKYFQLAKEQYFRKNDSAGKVSSLLALSTLATHLDDASEVWASAYKALQIAQSTAQPELESSAELQIGILALQAGDVQHAIQRLERAGEFAQNAGDTSLLQRIDDLHTLALEHEINQQQRKQQQQNYMAAQQAEQSHLEQIQQIIRLPLDQDAPDWDSGEWLQTPMMLKLGGAVLTNGHVLNGKESLWEKISSWLQRGIENGHYQKSGKYSIEGLEGLENGYPEQMDKVSPDEVVPPSIELISGLEDQSEDHSLLSSDLNQPLEFPASSPNSIPYPKPSPSYILATAITSDLPSSPEPHIQESPTSNRQKEGPSLVVYCLGSFRVFQNDKEIYEWQSLKSKAVFKYLLTSTKIPVAKDILMDVFWPDADSKAARRNLHQAIYSLRQTLRGEQPEFQHIWFENDSYFLNPKMTVWLDFREFKKCVRAGQHMEDTGNIKEALRLYGIADGLYQGDFLEEDPYDDWPSVQREQILSLYLSTAERLSNLYYHDNQYAAVAYICKKVLSKDTCYEAAHRRLMQCYIAQGQRHLAVRQYQICIQSLKEELNMSPSKETVALYSQITSKRDR
jgi:DNA-binding SARP family transcriptional activator